MIHLSELLFLGGFLVFIVAILVVDMLVIDRKAHAVSIKEAGTWTAVWITLALAFSAFLWFHGDMVHGIHNFADLQAVAGKYAAHINLDPNDFEGSLQKYRHYMTVSYISGYLIEKTLSVDNLFVMMMIFASFGVGKEEYQRVELGNTRSHSASLRVHLCRSRHYQSFRLGFVSVRSFSCL